MVNLNKHRIAVYSYIFIVFTLIFGLSFTVHGNKITGSFVLDTIKNFGSYFGDNRNKITGFASDEEAQRDSSQETFTVIVDGVPERYTLNQNAENLGENVYRLEGPRPAFIDTQGYTKGSKSDGETVYVVVESIGDLPPYLYQYILGSTKFRGSGDPSSFKTIEAYAKDKGYENVVEGFNYLRSTGFKQNPDFPKASNFGSSSGNILFAESDSNKVSQEEIYEGIWFFGTNWLKEHTSDRVTVEVPGREPIILELEPGILRTSIGKRIVEILENPQDYTETEIKTIIQDPITRDRVLEIKKLSGSRAELGENILMGGLGDDALSGGEDITGDNLIDYDRNDEGEIISINGIEVEPEPFADAYTGEFEGYVQVLKAEDNYYVIVDDDDLIIGKLIDGKYVQWEENGQTYYIEKGRQTILEEDSEVGLIPSTRNARLTRTTQELPQAISKRDIAKAVNQLLELTLGNIARGYVSDYCEEQWDSSDYEGGTVPVSYNTNTQSLLTQNTEQNNCVNDKTTASAQAQKSTLATGFTYLSSWTITPCKENIQYTIYLANSIDEKVGIATGIANKGITKSESKQFSYPTNYQFICIQVSDNSIGDEGYACFNVVSGILT